MIFIKNIFLVSYLKNKGIRRICFVLSCLLAIWMTTFFVSGNGYKGINQTYNNFSDFNYNLHYSWKHKNKYFYRKQECAAKYLKKYNFKYLEAHSIALYKDIINSDWCGLYEELCANIKEIADKPVHLKCGRFEDYNRSNTEGLMLFLFFLIIFLYSPFIACIAVKITYKSCKNLIIWIYKGFKESNQ